MQTEQDKPSKTKPASDKAYYICVPWQKKINQVCYTFTPSFPGFPGSGVKKYIIFQVFQGIFWKLAFLQVFQVFQGPWTSCHSV